MKLHQAPPSQRPSRQRAAAPQPELRPPGRKAPAAGRPHAPASGATAAPKPAQGFPVPAIPSSTCAAQASAAGPDPDLPARRRRLRARPAGRRGPGRDQRGRDRLRHQPRPLLGRRRGLDAVHALDLGDVWGVDANGDGVADPNNPEDAIFAAARYLTAAGMPADTYGAIFAYNHADWYVAEVLADAGCYAAEVGDTGLRPGAA